MDGIKMKLKKIIVLVVLMGIFSFLFGCGKHNKTVGGTSETPVNQTQSPIELPEEACLTGLYLTHQGMERRPYYMMRTTENGTYMKISDLSPDDYAMVKDETSEASEQPAEYFGYIETVKDVEYAGLICLEDDELIRQLEEIVVKYGVLGWDGFHESDSMPGVMDSGDSYQLYLELSNGTTVTMYGYNITPTGFQDFYSDIVKIFNDNIDYSW